MNKGTLLTLVLTSLLISTVSQADVCSSRFQSLRTDDGIKEAELCAESIYQDTSDYVSFKNPYYKISGRFLSTKLPIASSGNGDQSYCNTMGFPYVGYRLSGELYLNKILRIDVKSIASSNQGGVTVIPAENMLVLESITCTDDINKIY